MVSNVCDVVYAGWKRILRELRKWLSFSVVFYDDKR
jgi:hypothetical protein